MNRSLAELAGRRASGALWIKFSGGKVRKTEEFRTAGQNVVLQVRLDPAGALVSLEIFPKGGAHRRT
jgi:hypothetical protein